MSGEQRNKAEFYQQHKDDPEVWGEPIEGSPPAHRRGLDATITVRFSTEEAAEIRALAKELGVSYSNIVRRAVQRFVRPHYAIGIRGFPFDEQPAASEHEEREEFPLSNAKTSTGLLALANK